MEPRRMLDEMKWMGTTTTTNRDCVDDGAIKRSTSVSSAAMARIREERNFFLLLRVFFFFFFFFSFFFFLSYYKGYSLHDCKLKNTQECTTQMLTSKPMYKENKCMWGCITWCKSETTIKPCVYACSQDLKFTIKQVLELLVPSSFRSFGT
jgi:hypothetical protein